MRKSRKQVLTFLAGALAVTSFLVLSSMAVVWANGLRFNPATGSFEQTALIAVDGSDQVLDIYINKELSARELPYRARNLLPGRYEVELRRSGFHSWRQVFDLGAGQVGLIEDPVLIATNPLVTLGEVKTPPKLLDPLDYGLNFEQGELTDRGTLITRFTQNPLQVHKINDYFLYQVGGEIRLFIPKGSQDYLIYSGSTQTQLPLRIFASTWQIVLSDAETIKLVNLTIPTEVIAE